MNAEEEIDFSDLEESLALNRNEENGSEGELDREMKDFWREYNEAKDDQKFILEKFTGNADEFNRILEQDRITNPVKISIPLLQPSEEKVLTPQTQEIQSFVWKSEDIVDQKFHRELIELEERQEKARAEYETSLMMKEDLASLKLEHALHKAKFSYFQNFNEMFYYQKPEKIPFEVQWELPRFSIERIEEFPVIGTKGKIAAANDRRVADDSLLKLAGRRKKRNVEINEGKTGIDIGESLISRVKRGNFVVEPYYEEKELGIMNYKGEIKDKEEFPFDILRETLKKAPIIKGLGVSLPYIFPFQNSFSVEDLEFSDSEEIKRVEIKFEELESIPPSLLPLKNLLSLNLSMNFIQDISSLSLLRSLVSLDLSQNRVSEIPDLSSFSSLQILNLQMNHLLELKNLPANLVSLDVSNNKLKEMPDFSRCKFLRTLNLFRNEISEMAMLPLGLEELDIGRNCLKEIKYLENCMMLKRLVLYYNNILTLPEKFVFPLLTELWLNGNRLSSLPKLIVAPCLDILNIEDNVLFKMESKVFAPNVSIMYLNFNGISHEDDLRAFLQISKRLKKVSFYENPGISEKEINYESWPELRLAEEVNGKDFVFSGFAPKYQFENERMRELAFLMLNIQADTRIMKNLEKYPRFMTFGFSKQLSEIRKEFSCSQINIISEFLEEGHRTKNIETLNSKSQNYNKGVIRAFQKIYSWCKRCLLRKRMRNRLFLSNIPSITRIQAAFRGRITRRSTLPLFSQRKRERNCQFAVLIQSHFRGYRVRKKYKKLFANVEYEMEELEEFTDSFFEKKPELDFELKLPKNLNSLFHHDFSNFGAKIGSKKIDKEEDLAKIEEISGKSEKLPPIAPTHYSGVSKKSPPSTSSSVFLPPLSEHSRKSKQIEKFSHIIEDWGLKQDDVKEAMWQKYNRDQKRKEKSKKKALSAAERYQLFLKKSGK